MFGFGSSFLSSASTLITSAVQDEPKTTPPTPRKMSTTAHVSPRATPPASPKTLPAKDTKPPPDEKSPQVQLSQTLKPQVNAGLAKQQAGKPPQQPSKSATPTAKSVPAPAQPAKQESGGFFGLGGPKTQPAAAKPADSVTGKMFGFGSSIFSSASTLITSAVQEEPKTTPPTPRKMSTTAHVSPKATPPVSPKMPPAKDSKPPAAKTSEPPQQAKPAPSAQAKVEKVPPEPPKSTEVTHVAPKAAPTEPPKAAEASQVTVKPGQSTCPLCKVDLNVCSKDPPNYNMCTECKNTVCNLCGFNPMPHTGAVSKEWLCLNCQTQRALSGQLGDSGKMPQLSLVSAKPETLATPATKQTHRKTSPTKSEPTPVATKSQPTPAPIKAVPTGPTPKAKVEPTSVTMETTSTADSAQIEMDTTRIPTTVKVSPVTELKDGQVVSDTHQNDVNTDPSIPV
uniref:Zinc finger piccolo-type domain-containing protein n=1 Tax=Sander lucioperca TaxID=283035 RepID=A0A8D0CU74_SANLU